MTQFLKWIRRTTTNIKYFFNNIKKTISWFPIIWKTQDFDYEFSLRVLKHSLERTADFFESDKVFCANALRKAKEIRLFLKLYDIVYNEKYFDTVYDNSYTLHEEYIKALMEANHKTNKAHSLMWRYFEFHVRNWWD